jgi:hypothetical protein
MNPEKRSETLPSSQTPDVYYIPPAPGDEVVTASERAEAAWRLSAPDAHDAFPLVQRKGWVRICGIWMKKSERFQSIDGGW